MDTVQVLQLLEAGTFNWKWYSCTVAMHYSEKLDPEKYNWRKAS